MSYHFLEKLYGRHHELVDGYEMSDSRMTMSVSRMTMSVSRMTMSVSRMTMSDSRITMDLFAFYI